MQVKFITRVPQAEEGLARYRAAALERCGANAERFAKAICPVDTGRLRASIAYRTDPEAGRMVVGSDVEYAPEVELGTGIHAVGGWWTGPKRWLWQDDKGVWRVTSGQRPQPYLRPALADHQDTYRNILEHWLRNS